MIINAERLDRLDRWDNHLWRGPCGAWHYLDHPCRTCALLARREQEQ